MNLTQRQRRAAYSRTHDIYGNDEAAQMVIAEMQAEREAHRIEVADENHRAWLEAGQDWLSPLGIDEMIHPQTKHLYDYGRDLDSTEFTDAPRLSRVKDDL